MKKFILFYKGPATPPGTSHEKWPIWFNRIGEHLVDIGSPMDNGFALHSDGSKSDFVTNLNGYSIVQAEKIGDVISLVQDHPFLSNGNGEYSVEVFELTKG